MTAPRRRYNGRPELAITDPPHRIDATRPRSGGSRAAPQPNAPLCTFTRTHLCRCRGTPTTPTKLFAYEQVTAGYSIDSGARRGNIASGDCVEKSNYMAILSVLPVGDPGANLFKGGWGKPRICAARCAIAAPVCWPDCQSCWMGKEKFGCWICVCVLF